jgi:hypothetical protein
VHLFVWWYSSVGQVNDVLCHIICRRVAITSPKSTVLLSMPLNDIMPKRAKYENKALAPSDICMQTAVTLDDSDTSDEESQPPPPVKDEPLSWRMDPDDCLSDWTIGIVYDHTDANGVVSSKTDVYHVHKCILASGSRKSGYFIKLFSNGGRFAEAQNSTSRIELKEIAAKAFHDFLDYLYWANSSPNMTTENATALSFWQNTLTCPSSGM